MDSIEKLLMSMGDRSETARDTRLPEAVVDDLAVRYRCYGEGQKRRFSAGQVVIQHDDLRVYRNPAPGMPAVILEVFPENLRLQDAIEDGASAQEVHAPTGVVGIVCGCGCGVFKRYPVELWRFVPWAADLARVQAAAEEHAVRKGHCDA